MMRKLKYRTFVVTLLLAAALVLLPSRRVSAQHYIGLRGGYGAMQGRFYPKYEGGQVWGKYNAGVAWKYYTDQQIVGGVGAEIEYQQRGYKLVSGNAIVSDTTSYTTITRTVSSLTLPLIWQPHIYLLKQRIRVFASAAITVSYNLGVNDTEIISHYGFDLDGNRTITHLTSPYTMQTARDVRWNYGLMGGFGVGVLLGRFEVFAEGRYYFGMSDILRTKTKYPFNEWGTIRSELDNLFVNVGFYYRLGKGGITEEPLGKRKVVPPSGEDFRNIKLPF